LIRRGRSGIGSRLKFSRLVQLRFALPNGHGPGAVFGDGEGDELDVSLAYRLVTHLDATLLEEFLDITLAQREPVVEPESVLDNA